MGHARDRNAAADAGQPSHSGFPGPSGNCGGLPIRHANPDTAQYLDDHPGPRGDDEPGRGRDDCPTGNPRTYQHTYPGVRDPPRPTAAASADSYAYAGASVDAKSLIGKIAFLSDRATLADDPTAPALSNPQVYVINPDGTGLALLTDRWPYDQAVKRDRFSSDQNYRAFVQDIPQEHGKQPAVFYFDYLFSAERQVTTFGSGIAYDPVWSPTADRIALVSNDSSNDEIWVVDRDGSNGRQLTRDSYSWWDKHPSWSPDGKQLVFWSNRSGKRQIWIMDADSRNRTPSV